MAKFSVLMSVYIKEKPDYLRHSLDSIFHQTAAPDEVIIVEDGSLTAALYSVLSEYQQMYPQLRRIPLAKNAGLGNALNEGLKFCSYELVARMDTDDISLPERFEKQLKAFELNPDLTICGGWISEFEDNPSNIVSYRAVKNSHEEILKMARIMSPMNHVTVMFRKTHIIEVGSYQPFYQFEDYYLWVRLIKSGRKFLNLPDILVNVRGGREMASRRGGLRYINSEIKFQKLLLRNKIISFPLFIKNVFIRTTVRLLPNNFRTYIYELIRRRQTAPAYV